MEAIASATISLHGAGSDYWLRLDSSNIDDLGGKSDAFERLHAHGCGVPVLKDCGVVGGALYI